MSLSDVLTKEFLEYHYHQLDKTAKAIADEVGLKSATAVWSAMKRHGVPARPPGKLTASGKASRRRKKWTGHNDLSGTYMCSLRTSASYRNLDFELDAKYLWELFLSQDGKCALTGQQLMFAIGTGPKNLHTQTASVDRIDPAKGYIEGNVQWIHKYVNLMKLDHSEEEFIEICCMVADHARATAC